MIARLSDYLCHACGGWWRSDCPHGRPGVTSYGPPTYCEKCGWWTTGCGH